jgi:dTDP-4-amino-4,6-dideoxygalactose transaminase
MAPYVEELGPLPATEELGATGIALPISPVFGPEQADEVVAALAGAA